MTVLYMFKLKFVLKNAFHTYKAYFRHKHDRKNKLSLKYVKRISHIGEDAMVLIYITDLR